MSEGGKLGTAYYELIPSMRGAQQQITDKLAPAASGAGAVAGRGFSLKFAAIAGGVGGVAAAVAGRAASAIAGYISEAAQASDATDKFRQTLAFAGLKSTAIDGLAKSTRRYADQTVYSLADIQGITSQLAANGVKGYGSLAMAAGNLNAVAGGNADTFRSVGMVLTQTAGAGKLITQNWNQLANAIPGASGKLQEALRQAGAYTGNFQQAMAKGQITAAEFNSAIMKLGMTDVAKKAATSTSTIEGAVGNLQASIVGLLSDGISKLKPAITGVLNFGASVVSAIGPMFARIGHAIGPMIPQLLQLWSSFSPLNLILRAVSPVLPQLSAAFGQLASTVGGALGQALVALMPVVHQLSGVLVGVLSRALTTVVPVIVQLTGILGPVLSGVLKALMPVIVTLGGIVGQLVQAFVPFVGILAPLIPPIVQLVGVLLPPLAQLLTALLKPILALIQPIIGLLVPVLKLVATVLQVVITWIAQAITWFVKLVTGNKQAGQQFLSVWNGIMSFFSGIGQWFAGVWNGLINGISGFIGRVIGFFTSLPSRIGAAFAGAGQWLWNAGQNIVQGLINGIQSLAGSIGRWFLSVIPDWIKAPFMAALGIHSPSTVFHEFGEHTMQGYINGLSSMQSKVQDTAKKVGTLQSPSSTAFSSGQSAPMKVVNQTNHFAHEDPQVAADLTKAQINAALRG